MQGIALCLGLVEEYDLSQGFHPVHNDCSDFQNLGQVLPLGRVQHFGWQLLLLVFDNHTAVH